MNRPLKTFTGNLVSRKHFKKQKLNVNMGEIIVDEEIFSALFVKTWQQNAVKYFKVIELYKTINNVSEIARRISHSKKTVQEWLSGKQTPYIVKAIDELKRNSLLPLRENHKSKTFNMFIELFAFVYGDGSLKRNLGGVDLFGQKKDLMLLKNRIDRMFSFRTRISIVNSPSIITTERNGVIYKREINSFGYRLSINSAQLAKLLYLAGAPKGDKITQGVSIPSWLMNASRETKRRFLSVLFGNELQCPCIRAKNAFSCAQLGFHKIEAKERDLHAFLKQIKLLLNEFGISTSHIAAEKCRTIRKDGNRSMKLSFLINSHSPNILRLFNEIPFKYDEGKQRRFAKAVETFLENSQHLKYEWHLYEKVMNMHKNGLGRRTIFKRLQLPKKYFYRINAWIHYGQKPLYYVERLLFI